MSPSPTHRIQILVVDDELVSRDLARIALEDAGYQVDVAQDGDEGLELFRADPLRYQVIVLDRMMPRLDGLSTLRRLREHPDSRFVQVVFATAMASEDDIAEGLDAGAYYYLTKPFHIAQLLSIVRSAIRDIAPLRELQAHSQQTMASESHRYLFNTLQDARELAFFLVRHYQCDECSVLGLIELFTNAIEHGLLGIGYDDKSHLNQQERWEEEVLLRQMLPANRQRYVEVVVSEGPTAVIFEITDPGQGFDWHPFMDMSVDRAFDTHGRGIALARRISLESVDYHGAGNHVTAVARKIHIDAL